MLTAHSLLLRELCGVDCRPTVLSPLFAAMRAARWHKQRDEEETEDEHTLAATDSQPDGLADTHTHIRHVRVEQQTEAASEPGAVPALPAARTPAVYWLILFLALLAISCAGTLLRVLADTPPLLKGFWRLFFVSWYLGLGFAWQLWHCDAELRARFFHWRTQSLLLVTGLITAVHFASWIWSLQHTSLSHSLFFVCAHPLLIVFIMLAHGKSVTKWEWAGVALGVAGSALMLLDDIVGSGADAAAEDGAAAAGSSANNHAIPVSVLGDLVAFCGAIAMVGYLYSGKHCRAFLPLFQYAFPVTFSASLFMLAMSAALEEITWAGVTSHSVFGFLGSGAIGTMLLIVVGPGITGHLGIQLVLSHIPPLAISVAITAEPVLGALIGRLAGLEATPHLFTVLGGPLTITGCLLAVYGTYLREQAPSPANDANIASSALSTANVRHQPLAQGSPATTTTTTTVTAEAEVEMQDLEWEGAEEDDALPFEPDGGPLAHPDMRGPHGNPGDIDPRSLHSRAHLDEECKLTDALEEDADEMAL